jgi:pyruvate-formate lyase-activating enzyme
VRLLLETHGLAHEALARAIDAVDVVSMDWKLTSDVRRASDPRPGEQQAKIESFDADHERFLAIVSAHPRASVYVKVVLTPSTRDDELDRVCDGIARIDPDTPLILQPVTPSGPVREAPSAGAMLRWLRRSRERLPDVRVIPQTHKQVGVL